MATRKRSKSKARAGTAGKKKTALRKTRGTKAHDQKPRTSSRKRARAAGHAIGPKRKAQKEPTSPEIFGIVLADARDAGDTSPGKSAKKSRK
jgi:hypothetical protein